MHQEHPEMVKDQYWDEIFPAELPYTEASRQYYSEPPQGSTRDVEVPPHKADFIPFRPVANAADTEDETEVRVSFSRITKNPYDQLVILLLSGSCHKRQKPQAPIRNGQTRKVANSKGLNRNTNLS